MSEVDDRRAGRARQSDHPFLYRTDLYAWSKAQSGALRRLARRRGLPNDLDLENVIEEVEAVGGSQLAAVEGFLRLIFVHLMKAGCARSEEPRRH